ncbi:hypothetical protein ACJRO7_012519 [Eucalyptus globulus]|uniref:Uncharacterized protein n=1 Tax=Eucalyptus globulus TaxID=34317 RepID=A0ABD3LPD8_EUCGL
MSRDTCSHGGRSLSFPSTARRRIFSPIHVLLSRCKFPSTVSVSPSTADSDLNDKKCQRSRRSLASCTRWTSSRLATPRPPTRSMALKEAERHIKNELKSVRDKLDGLKLLDKRTAIQKLERQLFRTRRGLEDLEGEKGRTFTKCEETEEEGGGDGRQ